MVLLAMSLFACNSPEKSINIVVCNPLDMDRVGEMVEIPMETIKNQLNVSDASSIILSDDQGIETPFQLTFDQKIIFPATVTASSEKTYILKKGTPSEVPMRVCGKVYPVRMDDLAWENDLVGFRAYGPALQALGERGFGYDLFTKRGTTEPVL